jgi:putative tryptophan/tyrosine transport system substrate-binding protein
VIARSSRRRFVQGVGVVGLALVTGCGRLAFGDRAQPPPRVHWVGWLSPTTVPGRFEAFQESLHELGYVAGQNLIIEVRTTEGSVERLPDAAADLVRGSVDVIVSVGSEASAAARAATTTIPLVFSAGDPVRTGLVESLARPGGNATGITTLVPRLSGKRMELLHECIPGLAAVAYLWNPTVPQASANWQETQAAARTLGVQLLSLEISGDTPDLNDAFEAAANRRAGGLVLTAGAVNVANQERIVALAARYQMPAIYPAKSFVVAGGLMAYAADASAAARRLAYYVDRILNGTTPADLPVEQPTAFDFIVNLRTARALGLTIPPHVLQQATEVIP